ncbi:11117_t:CDS:2 [Paraglomus occultum]|uniref:11117_t:CDS:1 n=1 Tax=Paraglomus occultum TaxID=144539 RepID=A0A9N8WLH7_9GLOM|nr:11117_t:CDS:2 [Paraglomus occultum]
MVWSSSEDTALVGLYRLYGPRWLDISRILGKSAHQCSHRWRNIRPGINTTPLTAVEHDAVSRLYHIHGPRWARISEELPDRTRTMIKNSREERRTEEQHIRTKMSIIYLLN